MYGIRVSKPGINVRSATKKELMLDSAVDTIKSKASLIQSFSASDTITHGLGYVPGFLTFNNTGTYWRQARGGTDKITSTTLVAGWSYAGRSIILYNPLDSAAVGIDGPTHNGMRVSLPDTDVKSTAIQNDIFDSDLEHFLILNKVVVSVTFPAPTPDPDTFEWAASYTASGTKVAHGLGFVPAFIATIRDSPFTYQIVNPISEYVPGTYDYTVEVCVDATDVWLTATLSNPNAPFGNFNWTDLSYTASVRLINQELK